MLPRIVICLHGKLNINALSNIYRCILTLIIMYKKEKIKKKMLEK